MAGTDSPDELTVEAEEEPQQPDLSALTLKERIAVATAQDPTKAIVVILLGLFAFTFYIAFFLVFPSVAVGFTLGVVVLAGIVVGGYLLLGRLEP